MLLDSNTAPESNTHRQYAVSYGRRFLIYLIDGSLLLVLFLVAFATSSMIYGSAPVASQTVLAASFVLAVLYLTILKRSRLGTIGYFALGVRIVDATGGRPTMLKMAVRLITPVLFPEIILFDLHFFGRTESRQTLADRLAGTYVVTRSMPDLPISTSRFTVDCFNCFTLTSEE